MLGDDGGLTLTAFPDLLGIHTSRFFHSANPEEQNRELLHLFEGQQSTEVNLISHVGLCTRRRQTVANGSHFDW